MAEFDIATKTGGYKRAWFEVPTSFTPSTPGGTQWDQYVRSIGMYLMDRLGQEHIFRTDFYLAKSADYTLLDTDDLVAFSASGAARTATLPTAVGRKGKAFAIMKTDSSANAVTVDGNGSETINGSTTKVLTTQYQVVVVVSDGANWVIESEAGASAATGQAVYKSADESVTNSTTLQTDDHLTVNLIAGAKYRFRLLVFNTTASATAGIKLAVGGTCTVTDMKAQITIYDDTTNTIAAFARVTALDSAVGVVVSSGDNYAVIEGTIQVNAAGTFALRWAQQVADAVNAVTVQKNSSLEVLLLT